MFSPHEGGPATATRSRRRQRPVSSDSLSQQPKAKRQRLPLTEQTFVNPDAPPEMFQVKSDKVALLSTKRDGVGALRNTENRAPHVSPTPPPKRELSVRSKKTKSGERISKGDGSVVLAGSNAYTVSKLPALPDRLRTDPGSHQHGTIYAASGYAVALTHTHAIVWPYTANNPSPETFTFALPYPSRHHSDPLPLGALVAPSASSEEPGLVVIMPMSGKISYWESISSAATLDFLRQQRNGVEDVVPGLSSGEHVTSIINAEPVGFVLLTSSGRLAYTSVRDSHGRPAIAVQFLRAVGAATSSTGFFGSIRHALKHSSHREDVVAVRAGPLLHVGERPIVAATSKGKFSVWNVHRGGSHDALLEADACNSIVNAVRQFHYDTDSADSNTLEVLDFTFVPKGIDNKYANAVRLSNAADESDTVHHLLALVLVPNKKRDAAYYLAEILVTPSDKPIHVGMVRPIASLSVLLQQRSQQPSLNKVRPRVYLPKPAVVAYVVFARAVAIVSLAQPPETPDSQLQGEVSRLPATFEDVVDLRNDGTYEIVGSGIEEPVNALADADATVTATGSGARLHRAKTKNPAALFLVRGVGVVRVATADIDRFVSERPPEVTAKSKLEQAVFYGIRDDNPLVFEGKRVSPFSDAELGAAAMELSRDILASKTAFTPSVPASLESNLRLRASYLDRLMSHLNALRVDLNRSVRWQLLSDAEKMSAATNMWLLHEQFLADRSDGKPAERKTIVSEIVEYIHEDDKKNPNRDIGEVDHVRHFFVNDVWRMDLFVAWAYEVIKYVYKDSLLDDRGITRLLYEGVEVTSRALNGATEYRQDKLAFYGLESEELDSGILVEGYEGLPEPWTSTYFITNNAKRLVDLCCNWLDQFYPPKHATLATAPDPGLIESIREALPNLTDRYLLSLLEHYRWTQTQAEASKRAYGERCYKAYGESRYTKVYGLKNYGLWDAAIEVAKKHEATNAMAEIMVEEVRKLRRDAATVDLGTMRASEKRAAAAAKEQRIAASFGTYGERFAFAVYEILLRDDGIKAVLDFPGDTAGYATRFLRAKPELAKISWINDVEREKDVGSAAGTLLTLGLDREQQVWNKKIELSLGKLALLAEHEPLAATTTGSLLSPPPSSSSSSPSSPPTSLVANQSEIVDKVDRQLRMIKIQDLVYSWVLPSIATAVDDAAELQLAMESHGSQISVMGGSHAKRGAAGTAAATKALMRVFEDGMSRLLRHEALDAYTLIDVLTLMNKRPQPVDEAVLVVDEDVFYLALQVAEAGVPAGPARRQTQRLIWRRCYLRDDWTQINNSTSQQDDESIAATLALTASYTTAYALWVQQHADAAATAGSAATTMPPMVLKPSEALGAYTEDAGAVVAAEAVEGAGADEEGGASAATTAAEDAERVERTEHKAAAAAAADRFRNMDDGFRQKLLDALRHEDLQLRRYLDKSRLEQWGQWALEGAEKACMEELERLTATGQDDKAALKRKLFGE